MLLLQLVCKAAAAAAQAREEGSVARGSEGDVRNTHMTKIKKKKENGEITRGKKKKKKMIYQTTK